MKKACQQRLDRNLRELASDLADLVTSGDLTEQEANEWLVSKQDQWSKKLPEGNLAQHGWQCGSGF